MASGIEHVERGPADGIVQPARAREWKEGIVRAVDDGGGCRHGAQARADFHRFGAVQRLQMRDEEIASGGRHEVPDVAIDGSRGAISIDESARQIRFQNAEQPCGRKVARQWQCGAGELHLTGRPIVEGDAADQAEMGDAVRRANGNCLGDSASDVVADEAGAIDAEQIEQDEQAICVRFYIKRQCARWVASAIAEQVHDDDAPTFGEERDQVLPEM